MFKFHILILLLALTSIKCSKDVDIVSNNIINTSHLEHLYQEIEVDNEKMGTIWIYSNAPEYQVVTDDDEGFTCVDDVSRALVFYCRQFKSNPSSENLNKIKSLSKFILYMRADNGYYYNFMFPNNQINTTHQNSKPQANFWSWRAYWALSEVCLIDTLELNELKVEAKSQLAELTDKINILFQSPYELINVEGLIIPDWMEDYGGDQISVIILGLTNYYKINPDENIKQLVQKLGDAISLAQYGNRDNFPHGALLSWKNIWHAWGNTQAYALIKAGNELSINSFVAKGLKEVDDFYPYCYENDFLHEFNVRIVDDSVQAYNIKKFPQIAYSISPMILASIEAYKATKLEKYAVLAGQLGTWYLGNNAANQIMYDTNTGRELDGIDSESMVNFNSGAESTIESLLAIQAIETSTTALHTLKGIK